MSCDGSNQKSDSDVHPNVGPPFDTLYVSAILERQQTYNGRKKKASANKWRPRLLYVLFFVVLLLTATSCSSGAAYRPIQSPAMETAAPTDKYSLSVSIEEQVLLDQQGIRITALSMYDTYESPMLSVLIENNSENDLTITLWHALVNGKILFYDDIMNCVVEAGKEATTEIKLLSSFATSIKEIELGFRIHDNTAMTDTDFDVITVKTIKAESAAQTDDANDSDIQGKDGVIYKEGGITIYVGSYQAPSTYDDSPAFEVGIANDSDYEVNAYFRNFFINGEAVESAWLQFHQIRAGNAWHEFMSFDSDELAYFGITALKTIDFQLEVHTPDGVSEKIQIYNVSLSIPESSGDMFEFIYPEITAETEDVEAESEVLSYSVVEQVLCDQYGIKLTAVSLDATDKDLHSGCVRLNLLMDNSTGGQIIGKTTYVAINGVMVNAQFSHTNFIEIINPGERIPCSIDISNESLVTAKIQAIKDIEFRLELSQLNDYRVQNKYLVTAQVSTTVPASFVQVLDDSGTVLLDRDGVKVIAQGLHKDFGSDTSFLKLYIENYSDRTVDFTALDVAINGEEIQPRTATFTVYPGRVAYERIEFGLDELDSGDSISFRLQTCDTDTSEVMFETDALTLTFPG